MVDEAGLRGILFGSSMLERVGLIVVASRGTTNSYPSFETKVMYLREGCPVEVPWLSMADHPGVQ